VGAGDDELLPVGEELDCAARNASHLLGEFTLTPCRESDTSHASPGASRQPHTQHSSDGSPDPLGHGKIVNVDVDCSDMSCLQTDPVVMVFAPACHLCVGGVNGGPPGDPHDAAVSVVAAGHLAHGLQCRER
jgi:hypothetical protein